MPLRLAPRPRREHSACSLPPRLCTATSTLTTLPTCLLRRRERQLADLVSRVRGTRALNGEASLLETPAVTSDGVPFTLRVDVLP